MKNEDSLKNFVEQWKITGPLLENIKRKEIREIDTETAIKNLEDVFESSLKLYPLRESSGLVDMQLFFRKLKP